MNETDIKIIDIILKYAKKKQTIYLNKKQNHNKL